MSKFKKNIFVCGKYGSGKSTIALNLSLLLRDTGVGISLVDLDVVNPYFRSSDMSTELSFQGVKVLSPKVTDTTIVDHEIIPKVSLLIEDQSEHVVIDVGDDEQCSAAIRNISTKMGDFEYDLLYVVNFTKTTTNTPEAAAADIEKYCKSIGLSCTGIINNSHVANLTNNIIIKDSVENAKRLSELTNLQVFYNCFDKSMNFHNEEDALPLEIYVTPSWYYTKR